MPTNPPPITPAPGVPQRGVKATFSSMVDAFNTWKANSVAQFGAVATATFNNAVEAFNSATSAAASATAAAGSSSSAAISAGNAAAAVVSAAAAAGAEPWVSGRTYAQFSSVISLVKHRTYRKITTSAGSAIDPANDATNWAPLVLSEPSKPLVFRSSTTWVATAATAKFTLSGGGQSSSKSTNQPLAGEGADTIIVTLRGLIIGQPYNIFVGTGGAAPASFNTRLAGGASSVTGPGISAVPSASGGGMEGAATANYDILITGGIPVKETNSFVGAGGGTYFAQGAPSGRNGVGYGEGAGIGGSNNSYSGAAGVVIIEV